MRFVGGLRLSIGAIASVALIVLGLFVVPWFTADDSPADVAAIDTARGTARISLLETEICHDHGTICGSGMTIDVVDGISGSLALATIGVSCLFGLAMLDTDRRHQRGLEAQWRRTIAVGGLGVAAIALAAICLATFAPDGIEYVIRETGRYGGYEFGGRSEHTGFTEAPTRAVGGWLVLAGLGLALYMTWRARPEREASDDSVLESVAPTAPRRAPIEPPPRGVETDPFRSPPAPPPIAVVKPRATTGEAPRADRDDAPGPALLR